MNGRLFFPVFLFLAFAGRGLFGWAGGGCFLPETPILLADGTTLPISEVNPGMRLLAFDEKGRILETVVHKAYRREVSGYLVIKTSRRSVRVTAEHPFFDGDGNFRSADGLKVGDDWFVLQDNRLVAEAITEINTCNNSVWVHNLLVDRPHTYFAQGVAVHN
jgi:hypothetical protein